MVSVSKLLSTCIDASFQGCQVIRDFRGVSAGELKEAGDVKSVVTQADVDAQAKIIGGLRHVWGDALRIIGEEDDDNNDDYSILPETPLQTDLLSCCSSEFDHDVPIEELTVFVDPLDGTREFVEGRVENVACLIGFARNKRSLGGVIGLPFPNNGQTTDNDVVVHYALLDDNGDGLCTGTWPSSSSRQDSSSSKQCGVTVLTGDSTNPVLLKATACCLSLAESMSNDLLDAPPQHRIVGGTAAKLRRVATEQNSIAILHFKTMLWDTCGPEALLHAKNGTITDLFGSPLVHSPDMQRGNVFGVVASSGEEHISRLHTELCAKMRADPESVQKIFGKWMGNTSFRGPQAVDLARDLDGAPLDRLWIEKHVASDHGKERSLKGYSVPESDAIRGMMSNACRLLLDWEEKQQSNPDATTSFFPSSVFYKRVVMSDLDHARAKLKTASHKLQRDVRSYQVETAFLTSDACQNGLRNEAGVHVNHVFGADLRPRAGTSPSEQIESRFALLLEDFSEKDGWHQQWLLDKPACKAALKSFAKMHAYFWEGSNFWTRDGGKLGRELEKDVWPNGGYMQPALQGFAQLEKVAEGWTARLPSFRDALGEVAELENVDLDMIGERLQKVAKAVGSRAHPFFENGNTWDLRKYRTLIHGDPKQANIFLREMKGKEDDELEVGLIDFQWSGFGLAATDVAHYICAAVQPNCVSYDGSKERELLDYYYSCLSEALVEYGVASSEKDVQDRIFPRHVLQDQYEVAVLDICRMVFAYAWARWKPESTPNVSSLNRNAYNKSLPNALWLITRCSQLLSKKESDLGKN